MTDFTIHRQLLDDCHYIGKLRLCHVLLHSNAVLPWFILVPETEVSDLLDLADDLRHMAVDEAAALARFIKKHPWLSQNKFCQHRQCRTAAPSACCRSKRRRSVLAGASVGKSGRGATIFQRRARPHNGLAGVQVRAPCGGAEDKIRAVVKTVRRRVEQSNVGRKKISAARQALR